MKRFLLIDRQASILTALFLLIFLAGCTEKKTLFTKLNATESDLNFENKIIETPELNVLRYQYIYNGGGIAAGDFNHDTLCDLYFTGNVVANKLYLNQGRFTFTDATQPAGVAGRNDWKTGVTAADINGDGWLDLYVCYAGPGSVAQRANQLFLNNGCAPGGIPTFTECAAQLGLDAPGTYSTQASFFDYDRDGDLDMFLVNYGTTFYAPFVNTTKLRTTRHPYSGNRLYRNDMPKTDVARAAQGSRFRSLIHFTEVSDAAGIQGGGLNFGLSASVSDLNGDGWPDLYVTNDYEEPDVCYLNQQNGTFADCTKQAFGHLSRFGMGSDIADINNDGWPDVVVMDMLPADNYRQKLLRGGDEYAKYQLLVKNGFHHQTMRNTLQLNQGNSGDVGEQQGPLFSEVGQLAGVSATDWSWAPLLADFDNDGNKDLFITNGFLRDFTNQDFLKYTVEEAEQRAAQAGKPFVLFSLIAKMPSTKVSNCIFRNNGNLTFDDKTKAWGIEYPDMSFGAVYADLDNDGDLDLITNNTNEAAGVWQNNAQASEKSNYLALELVGEGANRFGIGTRITVRTKASEQTQEQQPTRGYQSSVEPLLHFGLGKQAVIDEIRVVWPDGRVTVKRNVPANQRLKIEQKNAARPPTATPKNTTNPANLFADITANAGVNYIHRENEFVDFDHEPLIPKQLSRMGPCLAAGDVNRDGLTDFFIGGAAGQAGQLFLLTATGQFRPVATQPWQQDAACEDEGATFFDADSDGDLDLYVVSGGTEFPTGSPALTDRLYINAGAGQFKKAPAGSLPVEFANGSCVTAADYDRDGDMDLYVGGRVQPGAYPLPSPGGLLRNDTDPRTGQLKFTVATATVNPALREPGMVSAAQWTDFNNDGWPDLILVGDWMPIRLFENRRGKLVETAQESLGNTQGFWTRILPGDFDHDGDMDYVLGNAGTNLPWHASPAEPLTLHYGDFNDDGRIDPLMCSYVQGVSYPVATRDELLSQLNGLRKKYVRYAQYANAKIDSILTSSQIANAQHLRVVTLQSSYLKNLGKGKFALSPLPIEAQFSMANGLLSDDYDRDGHLDVLLSGNFYPYRVQAGKCDAGLGLLLRGNGRGNFRPVSWPQTGFLVPGDVRGMISLRAGKRGQYIVVAKNNAAVQVLKHPTRPTPEPITRPSK